MFARYQIIYFKFLSSFFTNILIYNPSNSLYKRFSIDLSILMNKFRWNWVKALIPSQVI